MKYASKESEIKLADMFDLFRPEYCIQDWEYCAIEKDPARLHKLVKACRDLSLSDEERSSLMMIVLNSMNGICKRNPGSAPPHWDEAVEILRDNQYEYQELIDRWKDLDNPDPSDRFLLSPYMTSAFTYTNDNPPDLGHSEFQ